MRMVLFSFIAAVIAPVSALSAPADDFRDHGVAVEVSQPRGTTLTVNEDGDRLLITWLRDHSGCTSLLVVNVDSGDSNQIRFERGHWDSPFAALLSSRNRLYAQFARRFYEFDPNALEFTFIGPTRTRRAFSMVEDSNGIIWAAGHQKKPTTADLLSFDPETGELVDHGEFQSGGEQWLRYPKTITYDDAGWIYVGIGKTLGQVTGYDTETGEIRRFIPENQRALGDADVYRGADGKVYARGPGWGWHTLHDGTSTPVPGEGPGVRLIDRSRGSNGVVGTFPDTSAVAELNMPERWLTVRETDGTERRITFDYSSNGRHIYCVIRGPDGALYGGAHGFAYRYDPATDSFSYHPRGGHLNAMAAQRGKVFGAKYTGGGIWPYDFSRAWDRWDRDHPKPIGRGNARPHIVRPHVLLAHPDGRHLILGGTPHYGGTGGGLYVHDLETGDEQLLGHEDLLENLSTCALAALPDGNLVGGTTISAGTGGVVKADQAELYIFDFDQRRIIWHDAVVPDLSSIHDIILGPDGLIYGIAAGPMLLAFNPRTRRIVHTEILEGIGTPAGPGQGYRCMVIGPDENIYAVFANAIARIEPETFEFENLAHPPDDITAGVAVLDGRLYFSCSSHLWSWAFPDEGAQ